MPAYRLLLLATITLSSMSWGCQTAAPRDPVTTDDASRTVAEYIQAGAPATDRDWTSADYARLAEALTAIAGEDIRALPRFESRKSGALMRRAVSENNLGIVRDRNSPIETRIAEAIALNQSYVGVVTAYITAARRGASYDRELVELLAFSLRISLQLWSAADEFLQKLTPEERLAREEALGTMRAGSAEILSGLLTTFTETDSYRPSELQRLARLVEPTFPAMFRRLSPESAAEMKVRLRSLIDETNDPQLSDSLRKLQRAIE